MVRLLNGLAVLAVMLTTSVAALERASPPATRWQSPPEDVLEVLHAPQLPWVWTAPSGEHLRLADPALKADCHLVEDNLLHIDVTARSLARLVELSLDGVDVVFSDNYFDLPAGRTVAVTCPLPMGWPASQAGAALHIRSVYDSFAA